jgi:hypothetical protein
MVAQIQGSDRIREQEVRAMAGLAYDTEHVLRQQVHGPGRRHPAFLVLGAGLLGLQLEPQADPLQTTHRIGGHLEAGAKDGDQGQPGCQRPTRGQAGDPHI